MRFLPLLGNFYKATSPTFSLLSSLRTSVLLVSKNSFHQTNVQMAKVAVVLSGCGVFDGTEIHEASACLVHLSRAGANVKIFAPDVDQMHTLDHIKGENMEKSNRNVLIESARIARGEISDLAQLKTADHDLLVFPGGFGAAKNLSNWAVDNQNFTLNPDVERVIKEFHSNQKPIALCCISPILAAKAISGCELTVGSADSNDPKWPYSSAAATISAVGCTHVEKPVTECHVDKKNKLVTAPAFMWKDASQGWNSLHLIFDGIGSMIDQALKLCK